MAHLLVGLVLTALGIWGVVAWWSVFGIVMRGVVPLLLLLVGLAALLSGQRRTSRAQSRPQTASAADLGGNGASQGVDIAETLGR